MILQLALQIVLPAVFLGVLWRSRSKSKLDWLLQVLVLGSFLLFSSLTARWDLFSYYLRILLVPLFGIASYIAYRKIAPASASANRSRQWAGMAINGALLLVATWFNVSALRGYFYAGDAIDLASPLRNGLYYVGGGGSSHWLNGHSADSASGNDFALDIVRLNVLGSQVVPGLPIVPTHADGATAVAAQAQQLIPSQEQEGPCRRPLGDDMESGIQKIARLAQPYGDGAQK